MSNKRTVKALEELVKTEHMSVAALDAALAEVHDNKTRRQYRKWRNSHMKQANALNTRLEDLGGDPVEYELGSGKGQATIWGKLTGMKDDISVAGMRIGAERGIKRYIDHLDEIDDPKSLGIIRKNLESKKDEIEWYDDQANKERAKKVETKIEASQEKSKELAIEASNGKKGGGFPLPLLLIAGAIGAAAIFLMRRGDESDYDDYGEDAFRYEGEGETSSESGYSSSGSYGSPGNGAGTDYSSGASNSGDVSTPS